MLATAYRLNRSSQIAKVQKLGRLVKATVVQVRGLANRRGETRLTVIVSKKAWRLATRRNLWKRQARQLVQSQFCQIESKTGQLKPNIGGFDLVVTLLPLPSGWTTAQYQDKLNEELEQCLRSFVSA